MRIALALSAACYLSLLAGPARAAEQVPVKPAPAPAQLDETYLHVYQHVDGTFIGVLPADWSAWKARFNGKLTSTGSLRAVLDVMLSSPSDLQLRVLTPDQVEKYLARQAGGFVGIGVDFKAIYTLNDGFLVEDVQKDSPARAAGVRSGSTIVAIDGSRLQGMNYNEALALLLAQKTTVKLTLKIGDQEQEVTVNRAKGQKLGIEFRSGKTTLRETVVRVLPGSPAESAGVQVGDEISHVNDNKIVDADPDWFRGQATYGEIGTVISLTTVRDGKPVKFEIKRAVVENEELAFTLSEKDGVRVLRLINLNWSALPQRLDRQIAELAKSDTAIIDLRGTSGDNLEVAARIAARLIAGGDVIAYRQRQDGQLSTGRYFVEQRAGKATLCLESAGAVTQIEQPAAGAYSTKLTVLVDEHTSGTAEALALALQRNGATVAGTKTAGRSNLVAMKVFKAGDAEYYVEVPTTTLIGNQDQSIAVTPDKNEAGFSGGATLPVLGLIVAAIVLIICARKAVRSNGWKRVGFAGALLVAVSATVLAAWKLHGELKPQTKAQKAAAFIGNILKTDERARADGLRYAQIKRGKRDAKPEFGQEPKELAAAEIDAACRIVTAITEGDIDAFRAIVAGYAYMPYARAQVGNSLSYTFYLAGVDYRFEFFLSGHFGIDSGKLMDGRFGISFSALNEEPVVNLMVRDPQFPGQFQTEPTDLVTAKEVLSAIRLSVIRSALERQAEESRRP